MEAYERLQAPGCVDSNVELSHVNSPSAEQNESINWFPDQAPAIAAAETCETSWQSEDDNEFFWQELTEEELSERQGLENHIKSSCLHILVIEHSWKCPKDLHLDDGVLK